MLVLNSIGEYTLDSHHLVGIVRGCAKGKAHWFDTLFCTRELMFKVA